MDEVGVTERVDKDINETIPVKLSSIQSPDETNKNIEIHQIESINTYSRSGNVEVPVVEVPGTMDPLISDFQQPARTENSNQTYFNVNQLGQSSRK